MNNKSQRQILESTWKLEKQSSQASRETGVTESCETLLVLNPDLEEIQIFSTVESFIFNHWSHNWKIIFKTKFIRFVFSFIISGFNDTYSNNFGVVLYAILF